MKFSQAILKSVVYRIFSWGLASVLYWFYFGQPAILQIGLIVAAVEIAKGLLYVLFELLWPRLIDRGRGKTASTAPPGSPGASP